MSDKPLIIAGYTLTHEQENCPCHRFNDMRLYTGKESGIACRICGLPVEVLHIINTEFNNWLKTIFK